MAIVKMNKLQAVAMAGERDALLRELLLLGCVELSSQEQLLDDPETGARLTPEHGDLAASQAGRQRYRQALAILDQYAPRKTPLLASRPEISASALLDEDDKAVMERTAEELIAFSERLKTLDAERTREELRIETLAPWKPCPLPLNHPGTKTTAVTFGTLPTTADMDALSAALQNEIGTAELFKVSEDPGARYIYLIYLRQSGEAVMKLLREYGYAVAGAGETDGTATEGITAAEERLRAIDAEQQQVLERIQAAAVHRDALQRSFDRATTEVDRAEATGKLVRLDHTLLLEGWCPEERKDDVAKLLEKHGCAYEFQTPSEEEYPDVPVTLNNGKVTRSLNTVTNMYSLPAYNGVDPNPLMAPFFIFFYGMMMADMGYGLLMMIACGLVLKKKKPANRNFWELFLWCGVATFVWGIFTASFFGDVTTQLYLMFHPGVEVPEYWSFWPWQALIVPTRDALPLLIASLALGVIQIFTGMAVSMYKKIKRGETMQALCEEGAWYLVFVLLAIGILSGHVGLFLILILILLILTQGYGKKGFGAKFTGIFGSLYNGVTGYFSDILSYSRLMALMLAGAVIAQVFNQLGRITGNIVGFIIISLLGNALNMGLNLLGCYVHDMRLQCLEFFGRFYEDGGRPFTPLAVNAQYLDVKKE